MNSKPDTSPRRRQSAERGAVALVTVLLLLVVFLALAAVLTASTQTFQHATREDELRTKSEFAADSGAQLALSMIRSTQGTLASTNFDETLMNHEATVTVTKTPPSTYLIESVTEMSRVEMVVTTDGGFAGTAAVSVEIDQPTVMSGAPDFTVRLSSGGGVSGFDHDMTGSVFADQINGTYGFAVSHNNANAQLFFDGSTANTNGAIGQSDNFAPHKGGMIRSIVDHVRTNADHTLTGGRVLTGGDSGSFGTIADPVLVYCDASGDENYKLDSGFEGAGILVVENSGDDTLEELFDINIGGRWTGLVILYAKNANPTMIDEPLADLAGSGAVRGHTAIYVETPDLNAADDLMVISGGTAVEYSKVAVDHALLAAGLSSGLLSIKVLGYFREPAAAP